MPYKLFNEQGRTVNTSIFGFTKTPHHPNDDVLFVNLKDDGFESIQHKGRVDINNKWGDIENKILDIVNNSKEETISKKKKIYKKIKDTHFELYPTGIRAQEEAENLVRLGDLFDFDLNILQKDKLQSSKNDNSGIYDFITAADEWKKHSSYSHDCEALVYAVSAGGSLGKSQYVNGKFMVSDLCIVLTKKQDSNFQINMRFFNEYLNLIREELVDSLADGTSKLTLNVSDLKDYYVEYVPIELQNNYVETYLKEYDEQKIKLQMIQKRIEEELERLF